MRLWDRLVYLFVKGTIWLRYRVTIKGHRAIAERGRRGILFLPNHPALIDPVILLSELFPLFRARALADQNQINRFLIRRLARFIGAVPIPDLPAGGSSTVAIIRRALNECIQALRRGDNLVVYPAGRVYRTDREVIGANSAVERILRELPDVRIVLVRIHGLWGSRFSWAEGRAPDVAHNVKRGIWDLFLNALFFIPRRQVIIELVEPHNFPRTADRSRINPYLEKFYNLFLEKNTHVPYAWWKSPAPHAAVSNPRRRSTAPKDIKTNDGITIKDVPYRWFHLPGEPNRLPHLARLTIPQAFLHQARKAPDEVIIADQISGVKTYRDLVLAVLVLKDVIRRLPGDYIGIMMPASVAVNILFLAVQFAGKIPVMINWTLGSKNLRYSIDSLSVKHILTARSLVTKLETQGFDLENLHDNFLYLEDIRRTLKKQTQLLAWWRSRFSWRTLKNIRVPETAVILFTSGSESLPKIVPLTHRNIISNLDDVFDALTFYNRDVLLGYLPPFHSFGLTVTTLLPMCLKVRVVYYPNPTHGHTLAQMIEAYRATILVTAPTFLSSIFRHSRGTRLDTIRLIVTGAEKCPLATYEAVSRYCPRARLLEGYGVTECAPVISVNDQHDPYPGTIGKVIKSLQYLIINPETRQPAPPKKPGMLLIHGPNVFPGYLHYDGPSPFLDIDGKRWYQTGDLVRENSRGGLTFVGRAKRFVKRGGEMISLPAIETVLEAHYNQCTDNEGPILAVSATPDDHHPELVLFTVKDLNRTSVNRVIRQGGLSGLHNIRKIIRVDELPVLGTGKTNHRALSEKLKSMDS